MKRRQANPLPSPTPLAPRRADAIEADPDVFRSPVGRKVDGSWGSAIVNRRLTMSIKTVRDPLACEPETAACCPPEGQAVELLTAPVEGPAADDELAAFAKAIAHPTRVRILRMLAKKEARMCSHIVDELPLAQSTVSEHLRILRSAGLVQANENGPRVSYCIVPSALKRLKALLEAV